MTVTSAGLFPPCPTPLCMALLKDMWRKFTNDLFLYSFMYYTIFNYVCLLSTTAESCIWIHFWDYVSQKRKMFNVLFSVLGNIAERTTALLYGETESRGTWWLT